jgi:prepilin peptidase CpaA
VLLHAEQLRIEFRVLLLLVVVIAGIYDAKYRRIPNWLTLSGLVLGLGLHTYVEGLPGLLLSLKGFGLATVIYFTLYLLRGMGAGDVKLMAAVGSILGPLPWFILFLATSIAGAIVAVVLSVGYGRFRSTLYNVLKIVGELFRFRAPYKSHPELDLHHAAAIRAPHGTIIAATLVLLMLARIL